jgi:hypothetical protein
MRRLIRSRPEKAALERLQDDLSNNWGYYNTHFSKMEVKFLFFAKKF